MLGYNKIAFTATAAVASDMMGANGAYRASAPNHPGELKNRFNLFDMESQRTVATRKGLIAADHLSRKLNVDQASVTSRFGFSTNEGLREEVISADNMALADAGTAMPDPAAPKVKQAATPAPNLGMHPNPGLMDS